MFISKNKLVGWQIFCLALMWSIQGQAEEKVTLLTTQEQTDISSQSIDTKKKKKDPDSSFQPEIGVGMSLLPLRSLWASSENMGLIQVGILGHVSARVHPHIDVEISGGIVPTVYNTVSKYWIYEAPILASARFYFKKRSNNIKKHQLSPYMTMGAGINIAQLINQAAEPLEQTVYFETHAGAGFELPLNSTLSLLFDVTALGNVRLTAQPDGLIKDFGGDKPPLALGRVGGQLRFGVVSYF